MDWKFITIVGPDVDTARISKLLATSNGAVRVKIEPTCLARECTNQMPAWRFELQRVMSQGLGHIINDAGRVNCDSLLDLNRSVRALSSSYHPLVFRTSPDFLPDCEQITSDVVVAFE